MSEEGEKVTGELKRELRLRDLVLFNLAAVIAISWLATSAKNGPSAQILKARSTGKKIEAHRKELAEMRLH
jgi:hypothetical protein